MYIGKVGGQLCQVAAVLAWMVRRGKGEGPLFYFLDDSPLTQQCFVTELRKVLHTIREDHSSLAGYQ